MIDNKKSTDPGLSAAERKTLRGHEAQQAIADHEEAQKAFHENRERLPEERLRGEAAAGPMLHPTPELPDDTLVENVRFSNRPFGVKHFQTIHRCGVNVAHGLALLFGIGTMALPVWDSRTRWNNLCGGLIVRLTIGPSGHTNSPHPSSREGHHSTARWSSISFYRV
jgi:hypothetical protein